MESSEKPCDIRIPHNIKEAVTLILSDMSGRDKLLIRNTKKEDLIKFHLNWGQDVRNKCGLWAGNDELMKDAGAVHPDSVSAVIMEGIWEELQKS